MKTLLSIVFVLGTSLCYAQTVSENVNAARFKSLMESNADAVVLDVRTDDEVKTGVIGNAVQIDYFQKDFNARISKLDRNKTYLVYCASGYRSGETKDLMKELGFKKVYNLSEGMNGWKRKNFPLQTFKKK